MNAHTCKICSSVLETEKTCKFCNEPTRLFCHACGVTTEKIEHPACMVIDVNQMLLSVRSDN